MAVVKYTSQAAIAKGRINHTTFQTSRAGQVAQNTAWLTNHRQKVLQEQRQRFRYITSYWRLLTQDQRDAWNTNAPGSLDGFHYFMRVNIMADRQGQPVQLLPFPVTYQYSITPVNFDVSTFPGAGQYFFSLSILCSPSPIPEQPGGAVWVQVCPSGQCNAAKYLASGTIEPDDDYSQPPYLFQWNEGFYSGQPAIIPGSRVIIWFYLHGPAGWEQISNEFQAEVNIPV